MKYALASRTALQACQRLFSSLGGSLLPAGTRIERQFRDLHAMRTMCTPCVCYFRAFLDSATGPLP